MVVSLKSSRDEITRDARLVVDSVPGLIALLAPDGDVLFVSRRILEYTGRTLEELKHRSTGDSVHPDDLPQVIRVSRNPSPQAAHTRSRSGSGGRTASIVGFSTVGFRSATRPGRSSVGTCC